MGDPTLLGIAAVLVAVTGLVNAIVGWRRARREAAGECLEHLREARAEAETATAELHRLRMG